MYAAADNSEIGNSARNLIRKIQNGEILAITSILVFDEVVWALYKIIGEENSIKAVHAYCHLSGLDIVDVNRTLFLNAMDEAIHYKLKPRDAIHVATMRSKQITNIISNYSDFDKVKGIKRQKL